MRGDDLGDSMRVAFEYMERPVTPELQRSRDRDTVLQQGSFASCCWTAKRTIRRGQGVLEQATPTQTVGGFRLDA